MKIRLIFLFLFMIIGFKSKGSIKNDVEILLPEKVTRIPIEMKAKMPFVKVNIKGKEYNFIISTGFYYSVISYDVCKELNLELKEGINFHDTENKSRKETVVKLDEIKISSILVKNINFVVNHMPEGFSECLKLDGVIGTEDISTLFWKFNYKDKYVEVTEDLSLFDMKDFNIHWDFHPTISNRIGLPSIFYQQKLYLLFDTGNNSYIHMATNFIINVQDSVKTEIVPSKRINNIATYQQDKDEDMKFFFKAGSFKVANHNFDEQMIITDTKNCIGNDYLEHYVFILDWKHHKIYLKELEKPRYEFAFPFSLDYYDGKYIVTSIIKRKYQPLKLGDVVWSINGKKTTEFSQKEKCIELLNEYESNTIKIEVLREGKIFPFELKKQDYFGEN